ncbi:hypothetical protein THOA03_430039 [Vibrio owensii]|nr:hypothetical protein THOA03_430039 [Vibrio owensii]
MITITLKFITFHFLHVKFDATDKSTDFENNKATINWANRAINDKKGPARCRAFSKIR